MMPEDMDLLRHYAQDGSPRSRAANSCRRELPMEGEYVAGVGHRPYVGGPAPKEAAGCLRPPVFQPALTSGVD